MSKVRDWVNEYADDAEEPILVMDEFDDALIGLCHRFGQPPVAIYDKAKIIEILIAGGCSEEDALEHFDFNIIGGWVGEYTPAFLVYPPDEGDETVEEDALPPYRDSWALRNNQ